MIEEKICRTFKRKISQSKNYENQAYINQRSFSFLFSSLNFFALLWENAKKRKKEKNEWLKVSLFFLSLFSQNNPANNHHQGKRKPPQTRTKTAFFSPCCVLFYVFVVGCFPFFSHFFICKKTEQKKNIAGNLEARVQSFFLLCFFQRNFSLKKQKPHLFLCLFVYLFF